MDDLGQDGVDTILFLEAPYAHQNLIDPLYSILDDVKARRKILKQNTIKGRFKDLDLIQSHRQKLQRSPVLNNLIKALFEPEAEAQIQPTDLLFLNAYYRRILRARLERDYEGRELLPGLVITGYHNFEMDASMVGLLQLLRLICKYLGLKSTFHTGTFPLEKLYEPSLWASITRKLIQLLGETRIQPLASDLPLPRVTLEDQAMYDGLKKVRQAEVLGVLKTLFNLWSGAQLELSSDHTQVHLKSPLYIQRLMPLLRSFGGNMEAGSSSQ